MRRSRILAGLAVGVVAVVVAVLAGIGGPSPTGERRVALAYGKAPLGFEPNRGQSAQGVRFVSRGSGYGIFVTDREVVLALGGGPGAARGRDARAAVLRMQVVGGSSTARPRAAGLLGRRVNYLVGEDRKRWRTSVPAYRRIVYDRVYPGIDLVLRGDQRQLEYDFVVAPGADPETIAVEFAGARDVSIDRQGHLIIATSAGTIRQRPPVVYQEVDGVRRRVAGRFALRNGRVGFAVGGYDRSRPLVIDPVIEYSTFLGGAASYDAAFGLAVDGSGAAYVSGLTFAADFPVTEGAVDEDGRTRSVCKPAEDPGFEPPPLDHCRSDAFVTKLSPDGTELVYSTFLGGSKSDRAQDIAVDERGAAYITGGTDSTDFPTTEGAIDRTAGGDRRVMGLGLVVLAEAFVAKLAPDGASLEYSTLLGGADAEEATAVKVDASGAAYITGHSFSSDLPTTNGAYDREINGTDTPPGAACADIFVTKVKPSGRALEYSTFVGGSRLEFSWDLDIDDSGAAYLMGESMSPDAPTTPGAFQPEGHVKGGREVADCAEPLAQADDADPLVVKMAADGSALQYATHVGGSSHEHGLGIAVHKGSAYIVGHTGSRDFPTTEGALQRTPKVTDTSFDGFATRLSPAGDALVYSTLHGGSDDDWLFDVTVDKSGSAFVTGMSASADFATSDDALDRTNLGPTAPMYDAVVARLDPDGSSLLYSSYFGGALPDVGLAIERGPAGAVHIAGLTFSPDLPTTAEAAGPVFQGPVGYSDAFVTRFSGFAELSRAGTATPRGGGRRRHAQRLGGGARTADAHLLSREGGIPLRSPISARKPNSQ